MFNLFEGMCQNAEIGVGFFGFYCIMIPTNIVNLVSYLSNWIYEWPFMVFKYFMVLKVSRVGTVVSIL